MLLSDGLRKKKCFLEGNNIEVDGIMYPIETIKEIDDYKSRWLLVAVLSIQTIVVFSIISYLVYRDDIANVIKPDEGSVVLVAFILLLCLSTVVLLFRGIQNRRNYRSAWTYNDSKMLLIENIDSPDIEFKLKDITRTIESATIARAVKCPHCNLKTPILSPGQHSCRQCKTVFTLKDNFELSDIKEPRYYLLLMIISFLVFVFYPFFLKDRISPYLGEQFFLVPLLLVFGFMIAQAIHHGIIISGYGDDIYRADSPKMFLLCLLLLVSLELYLLYGYIEMEFIR